MSDDTKKPTQNDVDKGWKPAPGEEAKWKEIVLSGTPKKKPGVEGWDELDPAIDGMVVMYEWATGLLKVACGGIKYEINFENCWPPLPAAEPAPGACDPRKDTERSYIAEVKDVKYWAYFRQTKCVLQINCAFEYWIVTKTVRCDKSLRKWRPKGQAKESGLYKTRASYFTCPCGE